MTPTEKLIFKHFGIRRFQHVINKLEKQSEDVFMDNLFIEKNLYIKKIKELNESINMLGDSYPDIRAMMEG